MREVGYMLTNTIYTQEDESLEEFVDQIILCEEGNQIPPSERGNVLATISFMPDEGEESFLIVGLAKEEYDAIMKHLIKTSSRWKMFRHASINEALLVLEKYENAKVELYECRKTYVTPLLVDGKYKITSLLFPRFLIQ